MSIREVLTSVRELCENNQISRVDQELLLAHILGVSRMELHARELSLDTQQEIEFNRLLRERIDGIPVQYITGEAPFRYLVFDVGPGVLIPRPESEALVDAVLSEINNRGSDAISIVDVGAGSGALAISIAHEAALKPAPNSALKAARVHVVAVEKEAAAISWLERNIARHEVDVRVVNADVETALMGVRCDIVIANPPYIPIDSQLPVEVLREPSSALFGGSTGLDIPRRFIDCATRLLKPGGLLVLEHHESQVKALEEILISNYLEVEFHRDLNDRPRWLSARRK